MGMKIGKDGAAVVQRLGGRVVVGAASRLPTVGELAAQAVIDWCGKEGHPVPVPELVFAPPRRFRFDLGWKDQLVAVEFQGGAYTRGRHVRPAGFENDCSKFCIAATMGWKVLPVTYRQFHRGDLYTWLAAVLADAGGRA